MEAAEYTNARWKNHRKISTHGCILHELQRRTRSNQGGTKAVGRGSCRPKPNQCGFKSALQKLDELKAAEQEYLRDALQMMLIRQVQVIPGHCKMHVNVNEKADRPARKLSEQLSDDLPYQETRRLN
ncbi:hypothetical protein ElyMa_002645400 [Elysia marginata]|uniref:Uncharacterized protein n=1 Tax=Elysia marginata TaxID=1093978 RepID=A0AAV4H5K5_9GAST|nr:hypothetical protein ElyMa_002645400 [Elysia marginata]